MLPVIFIEALEFQSITWHDFDNNILFGNQIKYGFLKKIDLTFIEMYWFHFMNYIMCHTDIERIDVSSFISFSSTFLTVYPFKRLCSRLNEEKHILKRYILN